jgi:membrane-associated phospholipid phosphatase
MAYSVRTKVTFSCCANDSGSSMKEEVTVTSVFRSVVCLVMRVTAVRSFLLHHKQCAVVILLATFGCLPARCQDAENIAIRPVVEITNSRFDGNVCFMPRSELRSGIISADPDNSQVHSSDSGTKKALKRFGQDQAEIYSAPFHPSHLKWDALFLAGAGVLIATDRHASGALQGNHLDLSHNISSVGIYGTSAASGALWLSSLATHNEHAREAGTLSAEAFVNALPVYAALQLITRRERPNEGSGNGRFWRNNSLGSSFPSGHALFTWSMASVIAHEYPRPWVKWLAYGTATAVSLCRFTGREHFPSDVAVGSMLGYLIGRHIFQKHCNELRALTWGTSRCRTRRRCASFAICWSGTIAERVFSSG